MAKKREKKTEETPEIFEVKKDGEEEIVKTSEKKAEPEKIPPEQIKKEKKIFIGTLFVMLGFVVVFAAIFMIINYSKTFEYEGVSYYIDKEDMAGVTLYKTSIPVVMENGSGANYNFYLRKDPRALKNVTFSGNLTIKKNMVLNMTNEFNCDGNGIIAIANLLKLYEVVGADVIRDENATCDSEGRYMFLKIEPGNKTRIEQFGPLCYKIYISNCEILEGTEKFMAKTFSEVNRVMRE